MLSRRRATAVVSANWWDGGRLEHLVRPRFWLNHYGTITALYSLQRQNRSLLASEKQPIFTCPREKAALYSLQKQNRSLLAREKNRSLLAPERKLLFTHSREKTALHPLQHRTALQRPNAMLSRRRAIALVRANWWDGGRLEHLVGRHRPRASLRPRLTRSMTCGGRTRDRSTRRPRSMVRTCDTFNTEGLGRPESVLARRTLPGASAKAKLDVITATMMVAMRLSLNGLACTISTGRLIPGPDPTGSGSAAHQISPRLMRKRLKLSSHQARVQMCALPRMDFVQFGRDC